MKSRRRMKENIPEASKKQIKTPACSGVRKSTNRGRGPHQNVSDPGALLLGATQESIKQLPSRAVSLVGRTNETLALAAKSEQAIPSTKIKLQLFPINEDTRMGLEKDGYNPFLELTLRPRKKISSVLAHINTKWGSSSVAFGQPRLFPFNGQLEVSDCGRKWTLQDSSITAGDVYAAVGSPPVFRLRYGWFSSTPEPQRMSSTSTAFICLESEGMQKGCNVIAELPTKHVEVKGETSTIATTETANAAVTNDIPLAATDVHVDEGANVDDGFVRSTTAWSDIFTDLSIGGLFSEASLQGKIDKSDGKTNWSKSITQPISLISDISVGGLLSEVSLQGKVNNSESTLTNNKLGIDQSTFRWDDSLTALSIGGLLSEASLQGKIEKDKQKESKSAIPLSHDSHLSILDAEETCNAFSFQKYSSTGKSVRLSGIPVHDSSSNSLRFPNFSQLNKQTGLSENPHWQESKTEQLACSNLHNEDSNNSLGLRGIKWNDSLGPFDLGLSMMRPLSGGDSLSKIV